MKVFKSLILAGLLLAYAGTALGAVSAEEAKKLGTTLTPVGAEMAGNADGTIPPYTGGLTTPPATYKEGSNLRPDPFASEKPLFSIDAGNMEKYAGRLTEVTKALMEKYPSTYRIDVYPTHRTAAFPQYILDDTARNAVTAETADGGLSLKNALGGYPFPIPKDGYEVMWNHLTRYDGEAWEGVLISYNVDANGRKTLAVDAWELNEYPYNFKKNPSDYYIRVKIRFLRPERRAGEITMAIDPIDMVNKGRRAWQYLPGQRRVKMAPEIAFDTPNPSTSGATTYDDSFCFCGSMERYDWKLIGKKEMYVPYNLYKLTYGSTSDEICKTRGHMNPDVVRWELHRVWVVEANLKPSMRHIYSKRVFYVDEDTWSVLFADQYDLRGQIYRGMFSLITQSYDANTPWSTAQVGHDLIAGTYTSGTTFGDGHGYLKYVKPTPDREWNPEALAGSGVR